MHQHNGHSAPTGILGPDGRPIRSARASAATRLDESLAHRQKQIALLSANRQLRAERIRRTRQKKLLEYYDAFEWLGQWQDLASDNGPDREMAHPLSIATDRRYGDNYPLWRSWQEHARLRAASRLLVETSPLASGALGAIRSYVIGKGMQARAVARQPDCPKELLLAVSDLIADFERANSWSTLQRELFFRDRRDGEYFLRLWPQRDGMVLARPVEPMHVIEPPGFPRDEASYGVFTDPEDLLDVRGFWVSPSGLSGSGSYVHAAGPGGEPDALCPGSSVIYHHKCNVDLTVKRGKPDLAFDAQQLYRTAGRLLNNMGQGAAIQSSIAFVRQHESAPTDRIDDFVGSTSDYQRANPYTGAPRNTMRFEAGTVIDMDAGQSFVESPFASNVGSFVECVQSLLRACAVQWNAPEWVVSADSSNNNFASSLVAESPFVRFCESVQDEHRVIFQGVIDSYLEHYCRRRGGVRAGGRLYRLDELRHWIGLQVTPSAVQSRDRGQEVSRNKTLMDMKVKSPQTIAQEEGLDWETESRNFEQIDGQGQEEGAPGEGPLAAMMGGAPGGAPEGASAPEGSEEEGPSLDLSAGDGEEDDIDALLAQLAGEGEGEGEGEQPVTESLTEGCVPNQSGKGHHDDKTGHPCTPSHKGQSPSSAQRTGKIAADRMPGQKAGPPPLPPRSPAGKPTGKIATTRMPGEGADAGAGNHAAAHRQALSRMPQAARDLLPGRPVSLSSAALAKASGPAVKLGGKVIARIIQGKDGKPTLALAADSGLSADKMARAVAAAHALAAAAGPAGDRVTRAFEKDVGGKPADAKQAAARLLLAHYSGDIGREAFAQRAPAIHQAFRSAGLMEAVEATTPPSPDGPEAIADYLISLSPVEAAIWLTEAHGTDMARELATALELMEACVPNKTGKGHHDDETGHPCTPNNSSHQQARSRPRISAAIAPSSTAGKKARAVRGSMTSARRVGTGKDAKVILADGTPAPSHVTPAMVGHDWVDVKVSTDPEADVIVTGRDKNGRAKTVYSDKFHMRQAAAKFARTQEGLQLASQMYEENQANRGNPSLREHADCVWLMQEQATRPGSESDNKGVSAYFDEPVSAESVLQEGDKVFLLVKGEKLPIKDKKTKAELLRRKEAGEPLLDSTYWLKSHGATTLEGRHIVQEGDDVYLRFVGKESVYHNHRVRSPELARMLLERKKKAGDGGKLFATSYDKVTTYAKTLDGGKFTPKDFRTQRATSLAVELVRKMKVPGDEKARRAAIMEVGRAVSGVLGNEPAQAIASYIDPTVFSVWS